MEGGCMGDAPNLRDLIDQSRQDFHAAVGRKLDEILRAHGLSVDRPDEVRRRVRRVDSADLSVTAWLVDGETVAWLSQDSTGRLSFSFPLPPPG
jgi:hypothetical protein